MELPNMINAKKYHIPATSLVETALIEKKYLVGCKAIFSRTIVFTTVKLH